MYSRYPYSLFLPLLSLLVDLPIRDCFILYLYLKVTDVKFGQDF